jgi:hypothetical protein
MQSVWGCLAGAESAHLREADALAGCWGRTHGAVFAQPLLLLLLLSVR